MRAMIRSHLTFCSPSRVSMNRKPGTILTGVVSHRIAIRPCAPASISKSTLAALAAREFGAAVHDRDDIGLRRIGGEAERIFDPRVARADHHDMLVDIGAGIVELILDVGLIAALAAHLVGIALGADGEDDVFGLDLLAIGQRKREIAFGARDRLHFGGSL